MIGEDDLAAIGVMVRKIVRAEIIKLFAVPVSREKSPEESGPSITQPPDSMSLSSLELSVRVCGALRQAEIMTVGQVCARTPSEIMRLPGFGRLSLNQLRLELAKFNLHLTGDCDLQIPLSDEEQFRFYNFKCLVARKLRVEGISPSRISEILDMAEFLALELETDD